MFNLQLHRQHAANDSAGDWVFTYHCIDVIIIQIVRKCERLTHEVSILADGTFDGQDAKVVQEAGTKNIYYGGFLTPDGTGHGHVKAQGGGFGESIVYWRKPDSEGGQVVIDNFASSEALSDHFSSLW